jgi:branched-chain amino acid aminotransferase
MGEQIFFQGEFVDAADARLSVKTHFMHYGTACFEGIRGYWNAGRQELYLLKLREHYERLHASAGVLHMRLPYDVDRLCAITQELARRNGWREDAYIRPLAYTSAERIGVRLHGVGCDVTIFGQPMSDPLPRSGIKAAVSSWRRVDDTMIPARAKIAGAYVNSALAKTEAHHQGCDDAILLNVDGHVSEGSGMNLFMVRRGKLVTPDVSQNILEGITRDCVLELAERLGLPVVERLVDRTELYTCEEVFMVGTGVQIVPVVEIDQRPVGGRSTPGPVTEKLMALYDAAARGDDPALAHWVTPALGA